MIRCTDAMKPQLMTFLLRRATENCFLIGDIENFSLNEDFIDVWKTEDRRGITSLVLRFYRFYQISTTRSADTEEIAEQIMLDRKCTYVSGLEPAVKALDTFMNFKNIRTQYLAELSSRTYRDIPTDIEPEKATVENIDELFEFQKSIEEFHVDERTRESFGNEIRTNTGQTFYIRERGNIVSSATVTALNSVNGVIIGVATAPEYRNKGYAFSCVNRLCREMVDDNKKVILFYDNPAAGRLYKKIGFEDTNRWAMAEAQPHC